MVLQDHKVIGLEGITSQFDINKSILRIDEVYGSKEGEAGGTT